MSQLAALKGRAFSKREKTLFWKASSSNNSEFKWVAYAIVDQNWKLMVNKDSSRIELYDLEADSLEKRDLSESRSEVVEALLRTLETWKTSLPTRADSSCFSKERK